MNAFVNRIRQRSEENNPAMLALKALRYPLRPLLVPLAARELRRRTEGIDDLPKLVAATQSYKSCGIMVGPWQIPSEIVGLLELVRDRRPRTILDLGTAEGGTLFLFSRVAAPDALLVSLDLPHGDFGGGYPRWRAPLYRSFAQPEQRIELVRGNSHDEQTLESVVQRLEGRQVDFLFIDGDHGYDGVSRDLEMYGRLVREGGVIAFHDIIPGPEELVGGVPRFWEEQKARRKTLEFVDSWDLGSCGIGVIPEWTEREREEPALDGVAAAR